MKLKELDEMVGKLSKPSKMPGKAWGIPAFRCHRGSVLKKLPGTVCSLCYASKSRYVFEQVKAAYERRYQQYLKFKGTPWIEAMAELIGKRCAKVPYFRWMDSGDLQDSEMLSNILEVCMRTPGVNFWLSTRERKIVEAETKFPDNLVIRLSTDKIDRDPVKWSGNTSSVKTATLAEWKVLLETKSGADNWFCPAPVQGNECGTCRACWDKKIKNVVYKTH